MKFVCLLWKPKFRYRVHNRLPDESVPHLHTHLSIKILLNIVLQSKSRIFQVVSSVHFSYFYVVTPCIDVMEYQRFEG